MMQSCKSVVQIHHRGLPQRTHITEDCSTHFFPIFSLIESLAVDFLGCFLYHVSLYLVLFEIKICILVAKIYFQKQHFIHEL